MGSRGTGPEAMKGGVHSGPNRANRRRIPSLARPVFGLILAFGLTLAVYLQWGLGGTGFVDGPFAGPDLAWSAARTAVGASQYSALSTRDRELLRRQRTLVKDLVRRHVGSSLTGHSLDDLRVLQELVDLEVIAADETFALQSLGVALGDVMAAQLGLDWVAFEDRLGRSCVLRLEETEVLFFPVTMISKRIESDVRFEVAELYRKSAASVDEAEPGIG